MFAPNPPIKVEFKNPKTKTSNLGKSRYTTYVRPDDIMSSKQLLKNTSPRLKSTLEYIGIAVWFIQEFEFFSRKI